MLVTLPVFQPERSGDWRLSQPKNILLMLVTSPVLKSESPSIVVRPEQFLNILCMSMTLSVFQPERLSDWRFEQDSNMEFMSVTSPTFQPERSSEDRPTPWNICPKILALQGFHCEMPSIVVRFEQLRNMAPISVTLLTFQPERSSVSSFEQPENMPFM